MQQQQQQGHDLLMHAVRQDAVDALGALLDRGASFASEDVKREVLGKLAFAGRTAALRVLLRKLPGAKDAYLDALLCHAAKRGHEETADMLLGMGADANVGFGAPLVVAAEMGHLGVARAILRSGTIDLLDCGPVSVRLASARDDWDMVALFLEHGAGAPL